MNILILSCGTRNKIVQYFRRTLAGHGLVFATDMSKYAPALYEADKYYIVPEMTNAGYLDVIIDICRRECVTGVLSLIDPELSLLAEHEDRFREVGTTVIGSSYELCERSLDKFKMYMWLSTHGYKTARSFVNWNEFLESGLTYPVFVKPVQGSASIAISKADDEATAKFLFFQRPGMMLQEYMRGQEIGADVYIDMISGEVVSIFTKKKLLMRAGETDKAVSFSDDKLVKLITKFCYDAGYRGQIDIDIFDIAGEYYISEVNPRFGGGYLHAYECGVDHMTMIANNLEHKINSISISEYENGAVMMKYNDILITKA